MCNTMYKVLSSPLCKQLARIGRAVASVRIENILEKSGNGPTSCIIVILHYSLGIEILRDGSKEIC